MAIVYWNENNNSNDSDIEVEVYDVHLQPQIEKAIKFIR